MKNRILGTTVLLAAVVLGLAFTACGAEDRVCDFYNASQATITVTCSGSSPNSFTLKALGNPASSDLDKQTVTRAGKDIEITSVVVTGFTSYDWTDLLEIQGSTKTGSVTFKGKAPTFQWKVGAIPFDE